jgi:hypothetical protein
MSRINLACQIIVIFFIGVISSCENKEQEVLLQKMNIRLEQQNVQARNNNQRLRAGFYSLMHDGCTAERLGYLEKAAENLYQRSDHFSEEIKIAKESVPKPNIDKLYENYTAFQTFYHQLKKSITDSFKYSDVDTNINGFMSLDKRRFTQKYLTATDSCNLRIHLQLLEADALINESVFIENIINYLTPSFNFNSISAIAVSDYHVYQKGDKLKITTFIAEYFRCFKGYAIIDGQKIEPKNGLFNYSRTITESPGVYKVPIVIVYLGSNNLQNAYPAEVIFKVE